MIFKADKHKLLTIRLLTNSCITRPYFNFFIETILLMMSIKGRINFKQLGRYGIHNEQMYRQNFEKPFDFMDFNSKIVKQYCSATIAIGFDPSYISKSGKHTYGVGKYWSGVAGQAKLGLEIGGIAAIDIENNTAVHLEAVQTPDRKQLNALGITLLDWYAYSLAQRADELKKISLHIVADAYFSKKPFADTIAQMEMYLISRLRKDANLKYYSTKKRTGKPGRPELYAGKINLKNIDTDYFEKVYEDQDKMVYHGIVYSVAMKRKIKLVYEKITKTGTQPWLLFFSTNIEDDAMFILKTYKTRFQIEFLYRDAKQFTGLNDCQARSENKLNFHFNASLTAVNIAKADYLSIEKEKRNTFSMSDVKTMMHNELMLKRFIEAFAIPAYRLKNTKLIRELICFGKIAA